MKIATLKIESALNKQNNSQGLQEEFSLLENSDTTWVRFGEELFLFSDKDERDSKIFCLTERMNFRENTEKLRPENLHLVVQKGNLFERNHPEVPVILNKGRFLIVEINPERASLYNQDGGETCWSLFPLPRNKTVYNVQHPDSSARSKSIPWIQSLVDNLERESLQADLEHLVSYHNRYSTGEDFRKAAEWANNQFQTMGGYISRLQDIVVDNETSYNIIAEKSGTASNDRKCVIVTAHLDSVNHIKDPNDPNDERIEYRKAPGADDNGSGSAGVLAMARALKDHSSHHDLRFILFGGEEQGLHGSKQYLESVTPEERKKIKAVINMDMIGTLNIPQLSVLIEGGKNVSEPVIQGLEKAAQVYTNLRVIKSYTPFNSDHVPFIDKRIPCVLTIEGSDVSNPNDHTKNDTLDHINYDLILEILRMNVAFTAESIE
jgi:hypothetical protein